MNLLSSIETSLDQRNHPHAWELLGGLGDILRSEGGNAFFAATVFLAGQWSGQPRRHHQLLELFLFQDSQQPPMSTVEIKYPLTATKHKHLGCIQNLVCAVTIQQDVPTLMAMLEQVQAHFTHRFGQQEHARHAGQAAALYAVLPFFTYARAPMLECNGKSLITELEPCLGHSLPEATLSLSVLSDHRPANTDVVHHLIDHGYMNDVWAVVVLGARTGRLKDELDATTRRCLAATDVSLDMVLEVFSTPPAERTGKWAHINLCSSDFPFSLRLPLKVLGEDSIKRLECLLSFFEGSDYDHRFHPLMEKLVSLAPPHQAPRLLACVERHVIQQGLKEGVDEEAVHPAPARKI